MTFNEVRRAWKYWETAVAGYGGKSLPLTAAQLATRRHIEDLLVERLDFNW
jgi:hypothetical protein